MSWLHWSRFFGGGHCLLPSLVGPSLRTLGCSVGRRVAEEKARYAASASPWFYFFIYF